MTRLNTNENAWFARPIVSEDDPRLEDYETEERVLWEPSPYDDDRFWNEVPW